MELKIDPLTTVHNETKREKLIKTKNQENANKILKNS